MFKIGHKRSFKALLLMASLLSYQSLLAETTNSTLKNKLVDSGDKIHQQEQKLKVLENNLQNALKSNKEYQQITHNLQEKLKNLQGSIEGLQQNTNLQKSERKKSDLQIEQLTIQYQSLQEVNDGLKNEVQRLQNQQAKLQSQSLNQNKVKNELDYQLEDFKDQLDSEKSISQTLKTQNEDLLVEIKKLRKIQASHDRTLKKLTKKIAKSIREREALNKKLKNSKWSNRKLNKQLKAKVEKFYKLKKEHEKLSTSYKVLDDQSLALHKELKNLKEEKVNKAAIIRGLGKKVRLSEKKISQEEAHNKLTLEELDYMKGRVAAMKAQVKVLKQQLKGYNIKQRMELAKVTKNNIRSPASLQFYNNRNRIGLSLSRKIAKKDIKVEIDKEHGNVVLRMDEKSPLFQRNSHKLSDSAKVILKKLIPPYAEALFSDPINRKQIGAIHIIGHASPRHAQKYVDPKSERGAAYKFNLDLSAKRAAEIMSFITSKEFGSYKYKSLFSKKIQATGRGFLEPIKKKNVGPKDIKECGIYDCKKSRRVELRFTFKKTHLSSFESAKNP